jgi:hypothetical protein
MTADPYAMSQEIIELQARVAELSVALEAVTIQRNDCRDAADSLHAELEISRRRLSEVSAVVDRLRLHIQQGVEL